MGRYQTELAHGSLITAENRHELLNMGIGRLMKLKSQKGITLLEVMVSMIILSIGLLGLAQMIGMSIYGNSFASDTTAAYALAQQEVELLTGQTSYAVVPYKSSTDSVGGSFSVVRMVEDDLSNGTIPAGLYKISVAVSWIDQQAQPRSVYFATYKSKD